MLTEKKYYYSYGNLPNAFGLTNTGSICYFNSLMQALLGCPAVNEYIKDNRTSNEFYNKYYVSFRTESDQNMFSTFIGMLNKSNKKVVFGNKQEDTHELFLMLLELLNDKNFTKLFELEYRSFIYCKTCKNVVKKLSNINSVSIEFNVEELDVRYVPQQCYTELNDFNKYINANYSTLDIICNDCNTASLLKINQIISTPYVLFLTVMNYNFKKDYKYSHDLYFIDKANNKKHIYKLASIINHYGNMHGGHYIAKSFRHDGTYSLNDFSVSRGDINTTSDTYVLIYHLLDSISI